MTTTYVIESETLRRLSTAELRAEAERLRTIVEDTCKATTADRKAQQLVVSAGHVDDDLSESEAAAQAAWVLWFSWDNAAANREDEEFDPAMVAEKFRSETYPDFS